MVLIVTLLLLYILQVGCTDVITMIASVGTTSASVGDNSQATSALSPTFYPSLSPNTAFIISTIAGTGTASYSGDNGQATTASLNRPLQVDVDSSGTIIILDSKVIFKNYPF